MRRGRLGPGPAASREATPAAAGRGWVGAWARCPGRRGLSARGNGTRETPRGKVSYGPDGRAVSVRQISRQSSGRARRVRLRAERRRLASCRAALADAGGRVRLRRLGTASAAATTLRSRSVTASRLRNWLRNAPDTSRSRPGRVEPRAESGEQAGPLDVAQRRRAGDVPHDLDPGGRRVDVLARRDRSSGTLDRPARRVESAPSGVTSRKPSGMLNGKPARASRQTASAFEGAHYVTAMPTLALLEQHLAGFGRVLLGYSGGVDSGLLAVAARRALGRERFLAVIGRSASYPAAQWRAAHRPCPSVRRSAARARHPRAG